MNFLTIAITFLGGLYFFLFFVLPEAFLNSIGVLEVHGAITNGFIVVGTMAFGVGIINLCAIHFGTVIAQKKDWIFSAALLFGLCGTIGFGLVDWMGDMKAAQLSKTIDAYAVFFKSHPEVLSEAYAISLDSIRKKSQMYQYACTDQDRECLGFLQTANDLTKSRNGNEVVEHLARMRERFVEAEKARKKSSFSAAAIRFLNEGLFIPLGSSMFALLAFYIASAAYRAFRVRSLEAALLMGAAILVIIGQTPIGARAWSGFPMIRSWLLEVPNTAAFRGISLGASVASFVLAVRLWLSLDRNQGGR